MEQDRTLWETEVARTEAHIDRLHIILHEFDPLDLGRGPGRALLTQYRWERSHLERLLVASSKLTLAGALVQSEEWRSVRTALVRALADHPAALAEVQEALTSLETALLSDTPDEKLDTPSEV